MNGRYQRPVHSLLDDVLRGSLQEGELSHHICGQRDVVADTLLWGNKGADGTIAYALAGLARHLRHCTSYEVGKSKPGLETGVSTGDALENVHLLNLHAKHCLPSEYYLALG